MLVDQVFSAHLVLPDDSYQDITAGILNVDISHGTEVYEGPYQQIDTGLFTIVSRSSTLDPNVNVNVVEGAAIEFRDSRNVEAGKSNVFFLGYITDIDVQYQRDDDPIITITGTDVFGLLQRTVVSENLQQLGKDYAGGQAPGHPDYNGPSLNYLVNSVPWQFNTPIQVNVIQTAATPGGIDPALPYDNYLNYAPARYLPELGETLLEILNKYTQTNLNYCSVNFRQTPGIIDVYPYAKYNSIFWPPMQDPALEFTTYNFSSDPADGRPYESILLNNGYNRRTKALDISNETRNLEDFMDPNSPIQSNTITYPPLKNNEDVTQVATSLNTNFATTFVDNDAIELFATDIFQAVNFGGDEIQQITFNNSRKEDIDNDYTYSFSQLNQFIRIKHQLTQNQTIDRFYDIAGIRHNITPDKWEMSFTFKPSQNELAFNYQGQVPTIQMNALTGDSNFNFTATITDYPVEDIDQVFWCLNGTNSDVNEQWAYTAGGERYKDFTPRTGLTQTWNFDDDGILAEVPTGGYGPGFWYVIPYIILKNGWVIAPNVKLTVGTPSVDADFLWSQNLTNNFGQVTFTDDSHNNEIGEPDSYLWDFGDGNTSTLQNPVHQYDPSPSTTTYSVSLTVFAYGTGGIKIYNTRTKTVTLTQPAMTANYSYVVIGNEVQFTNTSTNVGFEEPDAYFWDFGDGQTSTEKNPYHVFPAPEEETLTFSVTLTTKNIWEQSSTVTKSITVVSINASGTLSVRYLQLRQGSMYGLLPGEYGTENAINPNFYNFKARTSKTKANLAYLKPVINSTLTNSVLVAWTGESFSLPSTKLTTTVTTAPFTTPSPSSAGIHAQRINNSLAANFRMTIDLETPTNYINDIISGIRRRQTGSIPIAYAETEVWTTLETGTLNNPDTATWFKIGSFEVTNNIPNMQSQDGFVGITQTMSAIRPMPLNVPYFYYTITNHTASFTSVETADSYLWTFGDGTTSTLKDPVKTFPRRGTYNVTLQVTNGGVVTRTTTEPVIIKSLVPFNVRHIKFVQNLHTGTYAFDTPTLVNFKAVKGPYELPLAGTKKSRTDFQYEDYNMDICNAGTATQSPMTITSSATVNGTPQNMWFSYGGQWASSGYNNIFGIRAKSLDASFRTSWSLVVDLEAVHEGIEDIKVDLRRDQISVGAPYPAATGITYSVYVTDVTTATINPLTVTWTKIGDFVPTNIPTGTLGGTQTWIIEPPQTYNIIPS